MSGDPRNLDSMVRVARGNLSRHGIEVGQPARTRNHYFVSPEFSYKLLVDEDADVGELVRANNSIDLIDVALATYDFERDEIGVNHGIIKSYLFVFLTEARQDLLPSENKPLGPEGSGGYFPDDLLKDVLPDEVFDAWIEAKDQAQSLGLDPENDLNFMALGFDLLRHRSEQSVQDELNSIYRGQVVTDVEHELLHKYQFEIGIQPHIGEIVNTIWSVERGPIYELVDEVTEEDLDVSELAIDSIRKSEQLGFEGLAADAVEFLEVYNSFRGDEQERLSQLMALQHEFVPQYESEGSSIIRSIIKGLIIRAIFRLLF